jgi:hypothetical protein
MVKRYTASQNNKSANDIPASLKRNIDALNVIMENISDKFKIPFEQVIELSRKKESGGLDFPSFILRDNRLGIMEAVTKYLKEDLQMPYSKIALALNRDPRVVWVTYNKALLKKKERFSMGEPSRMIPISVFCDSSLGPMEALSRYLVDKEQMSFSSCASLLNRDSRSIWACYNKSKNKIQNPNEEPR